MYPDEKFLVEEASFETIRRQRSSMTITRCLLLLTLMVLACADRSRRVADKPAIHLLRIDATVEQAAGELQGVVTIANPASQPVKFGITTLPCAYNIKLLSSAGAVVWDQRRSPAGDPGGCKAGLLDFELVPGDSLRLATRTVSRGELGDSLKGGAPPRPGIRKHQETS